MNRVRTLVSVSMFGVFVTVAALGQITYSNFSDVTGLALNGSAAQATNGSGQAVLRLTPDGTQHVSGTAWSIINPSSPTQQSVGAGFTTIFQFQITHASTPADGIAFVIQNSSGQGFGTAARGGSGGAIGYGVPDPGDNGVAIPNSLAIEFDMYQNSWDPDANHIAVQSCGTASNTQNHTATCPNSSPAELGIAKSTSLGGILMSDGAVHTAVIDYDGNTNKLNIYLDNLGTPVLTITVNLSTLLSLSSGNAWVGFTGGTGALTENSDILNWNFTPSTTDTTITQTLTGGTNQTTNFVFGSYNHKLQYSNADPDVISITAIPLSQAAFAPRLLGTSYQNDQCVIYEGTGGLCVEFEAACTDNIGTDCTNLQYDLFNNFNAQQTIIGPCMLKAPTGTNSWSNIIESFTQTRFDPGSHGSTKGFSDFILVQGNNGAPCTAPPTITITSPPSNSVWPVGSVPMVFSCTPDPTAPNVTASCPTGTVNGPGVNNQSVTSGQSVTFTGTGAASLVVNATDSVLNSNTATSNFTIGQAPQFLSANAVTFTLETANTFAIIASGSPAAVITYTGSLPKGVTLVSNPGGTATLSGTPAAGSSGTYNLALVAHNGINPDATQAFTLIVSQPIVTIVGSPQLPLTMDSQGHYVAVVTLTNMGNVTVTSAQVTVSGTTLGTGALMSAPAPVTNLAPGASATVTLTFPASSVKKGVTTATLKVSGTYSSSAVSPPLNGNWILSFRSVTL